MVLGKVTIHDFGMAERVYFPPHRDAYLLTFGTASNVLRRWVLHRKLDNNVEEVTSKRHFKKA